MKIKTAELFCASPASTAICTTMNHHAMVRRSSGSTPRPINPKHHNYYNNHYQFDFGDKPKFKVPAIPCTSQQHIDPKPYTAYLQKARKSTSAASIVKSGDDLIARRKSSAELKNPSKYLLNNPVFVADVRDVDGVCNKGALVVSDPIWPDYSYDDSPRIKKSLSSRRSMGSESPALVKSRSSSIRLGTAVESPRLKSSRSISRSRTGDQVVELRVSIHCKGCEGKVRKHLSKMEGVKSFHIDLESKKVTVVGDVTPSSVLSSFSKVKNAQLWPASPSSATSSPYISIGY
ncbi:sodium potassium root defective 2-like protein [Tanacetum coccineum]